MAEKKKGAVDDGHRKFQLKGGGPLEGVVVRHYPDPVQTDGRKSYHFGDIVYDHGCYMAPDVIPDKGKKGVMWWLPAEQAHVRGTAS